MKILVTGGTGLVGAALQEVAAGYKHDFTFLSSKDCNLLNYSDTHTWVESVEPQAVIHLAANVGGLYKNMNKKVSMYEDNILMNTNILRACFTNGVQRFVGMLSTCIFPDATVYPITEAMVHDGAPHTSNDAYAYAKRMLDVHCKAYREQYGLAYNCIIPTNIYGKNDNYNLDDAHVLPALIHKCHIAKLVGSKFQVFGSGKPLRQFVYANDLAKAIIELMDYSDGNVIVSPTEESSIGGVATLIADHFNKIHDLEFDTTKSDGQFKKTADNSKLLELLPDFKFTPLPNGLSNTISYFVDNFDEVRK
tara:strand:+ start:1548 stop:2468 length:921 start_codon:yes stop_codon:yes gene_type:complete